MNKLVQTEWKRFQREELAIHKNDGQSTQEAGGDDGASREDQTLLDRHMAHSVETADRYYDRSRQTQGRHAILDIIQHQYNVS